MTALTTIQAASKRATKYGKFVVLSNVGTDRRSTELFHCLVPTSPYRAQFLHHAASIGLNAVFSYLGLGVRRQRGE